MKDAQTARGKALHVEWTRATGARAKGAIYITSMLKKKRAAKKHAQSQNSMDVSSTDFDCCALTVPCFDLQKLAPNNKYIDGTHAQSKTTVYF